MDEAQLMERLQGLDASALEAFILNLRNNATMKLALRTMGKAKGVGQMTDILLDDTVPPADLVAFFAIAQMPETERQAAVTEWLSVHPELAARVRGAV